MDQPPALPAESPRHSLGPEACPVCAPGRPAGLVRAREVDGDLVDQAAPRRATEVGGEE